MFLLLSAVLASAMCCSCRFLIRQTPQPEQKMQADVITPEEMANMTPAELQTRLRAKEEQKRKEQAKSLVESFDENRNSRKKREKMGDVSRPMEYEKTSIFPWKNNSERRSETLHDAGF